MLSKIRFDPTPLASMPKLPTSGNPIPTTEIVFRQSPERHVKGNSKSTYFETIDQRHWVFHCTAAGREEVIQPVWLLAASSVPIQRHTKVKGEANPYDPAWEPYFEERLGVKMAGTLAGRWTLRLLWKEQGGICPVCNQKITTVTGWHNHHIVCEPMGARIRSRTACWCIRTAINRSTAKS